MFYGKGYPYGAGGYGAIGGSPAAGKHYDAPHAGYIPLSPYSAIPIIHGGPSAAGPAHVDVPHAAYGPFVHGGPEGGEAAGFGKGFGKPVGKGFGKPPVGKGFGGKVYGGKGGKYPAWSAGKGKGFK